MGGIYTQKVNVYAPLNECNDIATLCMKYGDICDGIGWKNVTALVIHNNKKQQDDT